MRVVNASPLIHLARVSLLELLRGPHSSVPVVVPSIVIRTPLFPSLLSESVYREVLSQAEDSIHHPVS